MTDLTIYTRMCGCTRTRAGLGTCIDIVSHYLLRIYMGIFKDIQVCHLSGKNPICPRAREPVRARTVLMNHIQITWYVPDSSERRTLGWPLGSDETETGGEGRPDQTMSHDVGEDTQSDRNIVPYMSPPLPRSTQHDKGRTHHFL